MWLPLSKPLQRDGDLGGATLQATALVHEAYLRLVDIEQAQHWNGRGHFFAAAAEAMRRILVENARHKKSLKCGGGGNRHDLDGFLFNAAENPDDLLDLDEALARLAAADREGAELVRLRFFAGLSMEQAAEVMGMSRRKAQYVWAYARSWLRHELRDE